MIYISRAEAEILAALTEPLSRGETVEIEANPDTAPLLRTCFRAFRSRTFTERIEAGRHYFRIDPPKGDPER